MSVHPYVTLSRFHALSHCAATVHDVRILVTRIVAPLNHERLSHVLVLVCTLTRQIKRKVATSQPVCGCCSFITK